MSSFTSTALKYGLNAPVIAAALFVLSVTVFGESSRSDVCDDYTAVVDDLQTFYLSTDPIRDSHIESLAQTAKNYSGDSDVQQDGSDLEEAHGDTYSADEIYAAIPNINYLCNYADPD
nr:hypothetical protein [Rhodococcus sp. (in: high G+C Gram-positive bacteria)]